MVKCVLVFVPMLKRSMAPACLTDAETMVVSSDLTFFEGALPKLHLFRKISDQVWMGNN